MDTAEISECAMSDSNLSCAICFELFDDPTLLTCGHTFCRGCLKNVAETARCRTLDCPECRAVTELPQEGVCGLKRNISVQRLINEHSHSQKMAAYKCAVHKEVENILCITCTRRVCLLCMLNEHKVHKIMTHQEFVSQQAEFIKLYRETKTTIEERIDLTEARREQINIALETVEDDVREAFNYHVALVSKRKDFLLDTVRSLRNNSGSKLDGFVAGHRQHLEDMAGALRQLQMANDKTTMNLDMDSLAILNERSEMLKTIFEMLIADDCSLSLKEQADGIRFVGKDKVDGNEDDLLGDIAVPDEKVDAGTSSQDQTEPSTATAMSGIFTWLRGKSWNVISNPRFHSLDKSNSFTESSSKHDHCAIKEDSGQPESD